MAAEIYVVSGFLGAGKTTLIEKLLKEALRNDNVVLIENDFGEISVDAALFKSGGIKVKEINSGCICCNLSGDFVKALKEVLERFRPDKIIIEPSGVGKLSDIIKACSDSRIMPLAQVKASITVVDVKRCSIYLDNFGEFFENQIKHADVILLSRTGNFPDKIDDARKLIRCLNAHAAIISKPWDMVTSAEILYTVYNEQGCGCDHIRSHNKCFHNHHHDAGQNFDTVSIRTKRIFSAEDLRARVIHMENTVKGTILRVKGIVRSENGYLNLQYIPGDKQHVHGDLQVTKCTVSGDILCIIGRNLNRQELISIFDGE